MRKLTSLELFTLAAMEVGHADIALIIVCTVNPTRSFSLMESGHFYEEPNSKIEHLTVDIASEIYTRMSEKVCLCEICTRLHERNINTLLGIDKQSRTVNQ